MTTAGQGPPSGSDYEIPEFEEIEAALDTLTRLKDAIADGLLITDLGDSEPHLSIVTGTSASSDEGQKPADHE